MYLFNVINSKISPRLNTYAKDKIKVLIVDVVNSDVTEKIQNDINVDDLFLTNMDSDGYITSINLNTAVTNKVMADIISIVSKRIISLENKEIYRVPLGVALNNTFLTNLLPKIPIRIQLLGNVNGGIKTNVSNYGINTSLIEVSINIDVSMQVILPFQSDSVSINMNVPLAVKLVQGKIPSFYADGIRQSN